VDAAEGFARDGGEGPRVDRETVGSVADYSRSKCSRRGNHAAQTVVADRGSQLENALPPRGGVMPGSWRLIVMRCSPRWISEITNQ